MMHHAQAVVTLSEPPSRESLIRIPLALRQFTMTDVKRKREPRISRRKSMRGVIRSAKIHATLRCEGELLKGWIPEGKRKRERMNTRKESRDIGEEKGRDQAQLCAERKVKVGAGVKSVPGYLDFCMTFFRLIWCIVFHTCCTVYFQTVVSIRLPVKLVSVYQVYIPSRSPP